MGDITIISGADGPPGLDGRTVLSGQGAPSNTLGANDDFYLDLTTYALYGPRTNGAWPTPPTSLIGPAGPVSSGNKRFISANDIVQAGDGVILADMRGGSIVLTLPVLLTDVDVTVKDLYGAVDGTVVLTILGTLDGVLNPTLPLIAVQSGWARLIYTASINSWSLVG